MKRIVLTVLFLAFTFHSFSQDKTLPEGWDIIILEGKTAYMNLITGDVSTTFPRKPALKKKEVVEYDPTMIHVVKSGETLSKIARKYNKSLAELYRLNNLENFDSIEVGQEIVVGYSEETIDTPNEKYENSSTQYHTVKSGETLYRIAKNYNLSVAKLKSLNSLNSNIIFAGQQLRVD